MSRRAPPSERAFALLETKNAVPEPARPRPLQFGAEIQFDHVSFAYGDKTVLNDINLQIKPGQLIALVGASGAGKTTLSNLLLRFYDPKSGAVTIGGVDIREAATRDFAETRSPSSPRKPFCSTKPSAGISN